MIDVIVPVYGGEEDVRRCITSVIAAPCSQAFDLVVVDDASPQVSLAAWLDELAAAGRIALHRNEQNLGFVATVNRGMALHPERDVVLLNSDTEVANDWLDRLVRAAYAAGNIGTVTPFSNNATICSYPYEGWTGEVPGTLGLAGLDALTARSNAGQLVDLPTAVGFCMFIRRACLQSVGYFDEARFGRGYGEENDFCRRALKLGWRNVLCADVFVYHRGGASFGEERERLIARAGQALIEVHPEYNDVVRHFIGSDPVRPLRETLDWARALAAPREFAAVIEERGICRNSGHPWRSAQPVQLHVSHSWGGGVDRWVQDFCSTDLVRRNLLLQSRTTRNVSGCSLELVDPLLGPTPLMTWELAAPIPATALAHHEYRGILEWIRQAFGVEAVIVSSLIGHALDVFDLGLPTAVVLHDFYPFCPALYTQFDGLCERCSGDDLRRCLKSNPRNLFWHVANADECVDLCEQYVRKLISCGAVAVAPSRSVYDRYAELFPALRAVAWRLVPHGLGLPLAGKSGAQVDKVAVTDSATERLRVLVIGRLAPHKGLWLLWEIREALLAFADLILLGCGDFGEPFETLDGVTVIPDYGNAELADKVAELRPDCALLLSVWPESFSYTLSEMHALGIPVVATRLGAFAERIEDGMTGILVAPEAARILERLYRLHQDRADLSRIAKRLRETPLRTAAQMVADYHALLPLGRGCRDHCAAMRVPRLVVRNPDGGTVAAAATQRIELLERELAQASRALQESARREREFAWERDALRASTSWRLTEPLRRLSRAFRAAVATTRAPQGSQISARSAEPVVPQGSSRQAVANAHVEDMPRDHVRTKVRELLFLPDSARIVIGIGVGQDAVRGLLPFARAVEKVCAQCPEAHFVWVGPIDAAWRTMHWLELGVPVANRRLFLVGDGDRRFWVRGGDLYLGYSADAQRDELVAAALAEGVPVLFEPSNVSATQIDIARSIGNAAAESALSDVRIIEALERS